MKQVSKPWIYFSLYILLLFITALTRDFGAAAFVAREWGNSAVAFVEPLWKLLFWIFPMLLFLHTFADQPILSYLKLTSHVKRGLVWGIIISLYFLLRVAINLLSGGHLVLNHTFNDWLNTVFLVGLIEESIFRGFLYQWIQQALAPKDKTNTNLTPPQDDEEELYAIDVFLMKIEKWLPKRSEIWAALFSTLIFAAVHFPSWIESGVSVELMALTTAFNVFFGLALCALLKYSKSLWACIIVHTINDFVLLLS